MIDELLTVNTERSGLADLTRITFLGRMGYRAGGTHQRYVVALQRNDLHPLRMTGLDSVLTVVNAIPRTISDPVVRVLAVSEWDDSQGPPEPLPEPPRRVRGDRQAATVVAHSSE